MIQTYLTLLLEAKKFMKIKIRRHVSACRESISAKIYAIDLRISFSNGWRVSKP